MASEVKYAPKEVIDALDNWQEITDTQFVYSLIGDMEYDEFDQFGLKVVRKWVYSEQTQEVWLERELAVIEHVFGNECLQPEREPRWYVVSADDDGECVVYFKTDLNIIDFIHYGDVITYKRGMSKQLADAIVAEVGGEKVEVK